MTTASQNSRYQLVPHGGKNYKINSLVLDDVNSSCRLCKELKYKLHHFKARTHHRIHHFKQIGIEKFNAFS
jgi:hypothetical protein